MRFPHWITRCAVEGPLCFLRQCVECAHVLFVVFFVFEYHFVGTGKVIAMVAIECRGIRHESALFRCKV